MSKETLFCVGAASGTLHEDHPPPSPLTRLDTFAIKHCCAALSIFVYLTRTCGSRTTHIEFIVGFSLQQWLPENAAVLRYTVLCLVCFHKRISCVLAFVKYVGCFQATLYQDPSHLYNNSRNKYQYINCLTLLHNVSSVQK